MRTRSFLLGIGVVLLLAAPAAVAQGSATAKLSVKGMPTQPLEATGGVVIVPLNVTLELQNVVCTSEDTFSIAATISAGPRGGNNTTGPGDFTVSGTPQPLSFKVAPGVYGSPGAVSQTGPYNGTQAFSVSVIGTGFRDNTTADIRIGVRLPAHAMSPCRAAGADPGIPGTSLEAIFSATFPGEPAPAPTSPKVPLPPGVALLAIALALGLTSWRRR